MLIILISLKINIKDFFQIWKGLLGRLKLIFLWGKLLDRASILLFKDINTDNKLKVEIKDNTSNSNKNTPKNSDEEKIIINGQKNKLNKSDNEIDS